MSRFISAEVVPYDYTLTTISLCNVQANEMGFAELRRELRWKEREIAELKSEVESREILIADMERNRKVSHFALKKLLHHSVSID